MQPEPGLEGPLRTGDGAIPSALFSSAPPSPPSWRTFAFCLLLASSLQIAESLVPRIPLFPWLRLGLSWVVLLPFLLEYGTLPAAALLACRNLLALACGGLPFTTFAISTLAGSAAVLAAGGMLRALVLRRTLGLLGSSIVLALLFNLLQLLLVWVALIRHQSFLFQLGPLLLWSTISGSLVAWLVDRSLRHGPQWLRAEPPFREMPVEAAAAPRSLACGDIAAGRGHRPHETGSGPAVSDTPAAPAGRCAAIKDSCIRTALIATALGAVLATDAAFVLASVALVLLAATRLRHLRALAGAWPFFAYLAWFHLAETEGHSIAGTLATREGLIQFLSQALRLCDVIILGQMLARAVPWQALPRRHYALRGFAAALEIVPGLFPLSLRTARHWWGLRRSGGSPPPLLEIFEARLREWIARPGSEPARGV